MRADAFAIYLYDGNGDFRLVEVSTAFIGEASTARQPAIDCTSGFPSLSWQSDGSRWAVELTVEFSYEPHEPVQITEDWSQDLVIDPAIADDLIQFIGDVPAIEAARDNGSPALVRSFPFILGRADPSIVKWSDRLLFIATDEHYSSHPNDSGLLIRAAATVAGLRTATDHRILGPDSELGGCFWAPELHEIGGALWCLFAPSVGSADWAGVQCWAMQLVDGGDPLDAGDWGSPRPVLTRTGQPLQLDADHPGISLDMTYFEAGSQSFLVWSQRFTRPNLGDAELWIAEVLPSDPTRLVSAAVRLAVPEFSWEIDRANVLEAPFVLQRDGVIHLTYSASAVGPSYAVGELTAPSDGDVLNPAIWRKRLYPLLDTDEDQGQWGPGHSMFTRVDGADLLVYHALREPDSTIRDAAVRPVYLTDRGRLVLDSHSHRIDERGPTP